MKKLKRSVYRIVLVIASVSGRAAPSFIRVARRHSDTHSLGPKSVVAQLTFKPPPFGDSSTLKYPAKYQTPHTMPLYSTHGYFT